MTQPSCDYNVQTNIRPLVRYILFKYHSAVKVSSCSRVLTATLQSYKNPELCSACLECWIRMADVFFFFHSDCEPARCK